MARWLGCRAAQWHRCLDECQSLLTFQWIVASKTSYVRQYLWWWNLLLDAPWPGRWCRSLHSSGLPWLHENWLHRVESPQSLFQHPIKWHLEESARWSIRELISQKQLYLVEGTKLLRRSKLFNLLLWIQDMISNAKHREFLYTIRNTSGECPCIHIISRLFSQLTWSIIPTDNLQGKKTAKSSSQMESKVRFSAWRLLASGD